MILRRKHRSRSASNPCVDPGRDHRELRGARPSMVWIVVRLLLVIAASTGLGGVAARGAEPLDVVFALDNSGSMRENDPDFLTRTAVEDFASALAEDPRVEARIALVLFDGDARLVRSLTPVAAGSTPDWLAEALARLDFSGQRTDSPAGVERALYELRRNGREEARQAIVLLSDGRIDTGDPQRDLAAHRWLRDDLAAESAAAGVRIFGVAFTEAADYPLMQALARRTQARYYRAFAAAELAKVVEDLVERVAEDEFYALATLDGEPVAGAPDETPGPGPPAVAAGPESTPSSGGLVLLGLIPAALLLIGATLLWRQRSGRTAASADEAEAEPPLAQLLDFSGQLSEEAGSTFPLAPGRTRIGRDPHNDLVLGDDTISSEHAVIEYRDGRYWLSDCRSTNGTRLAKQRLEPDHPVSLKGGDHIRFADIDLMFVMAGYVPGGATVFLSSSSTPPPDWTALAYADEEASMFGVPRSEATPVRDAAPAAASASGPEKADRSMASIPAEGDASAAAARGDETSDEVDPVAKEVIFAEERERLDPAAVIDLDPDLASVTPMREPAADQDETPPEPDQTPSVQASDPGRADVELDALFETGTEAEADGRPTGAEAEADGRPTGAEAEAEGRPAEAEGASDERSAPPAPEVEVVVAELPGTARPETARTETRATPGSGSPAEPEPATKAAGPAQDAALSACLDFHLARVAELSPAFAGFVAEAFDEEIRAAISRAGRELVDEALREQRITQRAYTANQIRYLMLGVPGEMSEARALFGDAYGGFTRLLTEELQSDVFRVDRCRTLAVVSFGCGQAPWVSLSIVPEEGEDPRIDLLSYEFLSPAELREIEPSIDHEISQSGLG